MSQSVQRPRNPFTTTIPILHSLGAAREYPFNRRNLESPFYPAFIHTMVDLIRFEIHRSESLFVQSHGDVSLSRDIWARELVERVRAGYFKAITAQTAAAAAELERDQEDAEMIVHSDSEGDGEYLPSSDDQPAEGSSGGSLRRSTRPKAPRKPLSDKIMRTRKKSLETFANEVKATIEQVDEQRRKSTDTIAEDSQIHADESEVSFQSIASNKTEPDGGGLHTIPDISVAHTVAEHTTAVGDALLAALKVFHQCLLVIIENKRAPSRRLARETPGFDRVQYDLFQLAQQQLLLYAAVYFKKNPGKPHDAIILIATAGSDWRYVKVTRSELPSVVFLMRVKEAKEMRKVLIGTEKQKSQRRNLDLKWELSKVHILGTAASDKALTDLRDTELIPLLNACPRCSPILESEVVVTDTEERPDNSLLGDEGQRGILAEMELDDA